MLSCTSRLVSKPGPPHSFASCPRGTRRPCSDRSRARIARRANPAPCSPVVVPTRPVGVTKRDGHFLSASALALWGRVGISTPPSGPTARETESVYREYRRTLQPPPEQRWLLFDSVIERLELPCPAASCSPSCAPPPGRPTLVQPRHPESTEVFYGAFSGYLLCPSLGNGLRLRLAGFNAWRWTRRTESPCRGLGVCSHSDRSVQHRLVLGCDVNRFPEKQHRHGSARTGESKSPKCPVFDPWRSCQNFREEVAIPDIGESVDLPFHVVHVARKSLDPFIANRFLHPTHDGFSHLQAYAPGGPVGRVGCVAAGRGASPVRVYPRSPPAPTRCPRPPPCCRRERLIAVNSNGCWP